KKLNLGRHGRTIEVRLERVEPRCNGLCRWVFRDNGIRGLQAVTSDADNRGFVRTNAAVANQLLRDSGGDTACGLRKNTLCFSQELNRFDNFAVRNIVRPAAGFSNLLDGEGAVCRIADG